MDNQLKPCPFCGKKAHVMMFHGTYIVGCITPMCYGDINHLTLRFFDKNHAIETWNRRAEDGKKDY